MYVRKYYYMYNGFKNIVEYLLSVTVIIIIS